MDTYEEKYNEALEKARQLCAYSTTKSFISDLQDIFPELKESEDEEIRKWIIDDIRYNMNNEPLNNSEYKKKAENAIAWLEKQGEQNTAWSEEDNFMYNKIKNLLTDISLAPESIKSLFDWLKDLRDRVQPQITWKPSDEQMDALEHFVRSITESGFASPYDSNTKLVYSLFNDLKKLKL